MDTSNSLVELSNRLADAVETVGASLVSVNARRRLPATGLIWSADGVIVTANHVVERDEEITVTLPVGNEVVADLVGRDPSTDIAVLRVNAGDLTPIARAARRPAGVCTTRRRPRRRWTPCSHSGRRCRRWASRSVPACRTQRCLSTPRPSG